MIQLPIELTHKYVKIDGSPMRIRLHCVDSKKSVCEFLDGPDQGNINTHISNTSLLMFFIYCSGLITLSVSDASKRMYGSNASGWKDFLFNGASLQVFKSLITVWRHSITFIRWGMRNSTFTTMELLHPVSLRALSWKMFNLTIWHSISI